MTSKLESLSFSEKMSINTSAIECHPLPSEILDLILLRLNPIDLQNAASVSKIMHQRVIVVAGIQEISSIRMFIDLLIQGLNIEGSSTQRDQLVKILEKMPPQNFKSLLELKSYVLAVKTQLVQVLKMSDARTLATLSYIPGPLFLENIFSLIRLEKRIEEVDRLSDDDRTGATTLTLICRDLVKLGCIERALDVFRKIPDNHRLKILAINTIVEFYAQVNRISNAVDVVVKELASREDKESAFKSMFNVSMQSGNMTEAIGVSMKVLNESDKALALGSILEVLARADCIDRKSAFKMIYTTFAQANQIDKAVDIVVKELNWNKESAFQSISELAVESGNTTKAVGVYMSISDENDKSLALLSILKALAQAGCINKAASIGMRLPYNAFFQVSAFCTISQILTEAGKSDQAIIFINRAASIVKKICEKDRKGLAFHRISEALAWVGHIDRAVSTAMRIEDERRRTWVLSCIFEGLIRAANVDQAVTIFAKIPNELDKIDALEIKPAVIGQFGQRDNYRTYDFYKISILIGISRILVETDHRGHAMGNIQRAKFLIQFVSDQKHKDLASLEIARAESVI